ncbi:MAG: OmpW family protein [Acinetobacter sp.]|uniref:OmpW/AlkL family protein n=1 Tax=Acinetobacter sp. TaxID=472 RepID=UPI000FB03B37|nr:OmpW family outer membrane protein [Acinetobacter sp.]RUP39260.1 MAG: OmpW family protein [Acinetobacter sp.]
MKKYVFCTAISIVTTLPTHSFAESPYFSLKDGDGFKRFSISAGWLHAIPQGSANPININTSVAEGTSSKVGSVSKQAVLDAADRESNVALYEAIQLLPTDTLPAPLTGTATVNGLSNWQSQGTGLEADDVDTIGIMANYHFTDHLSLQVKAGIPPKVNLKGKGNIYAPLHGTANTSLGEIDLKKDIHISNLAQDDTAASARAWLPAVELHYQFGKSGVNKFRPYVGAGLMYAYFNDLKINLGIESDLIKAGHMIQNMHDNKAGAALDAKTSSADPVVKLKATDTFAPIVTLGATYDFKPNWFAVGSISYSKMNNEAQIYVTDRNSGKELIQANTKIDVDPLITYFGIGYRF